MPYDTISIKLKKPSNIKNELLMDRDTQKTYRITTREWKTQNSREKFPGKLTAYM